MVINDDNDCNTWENKFSFFNKTQSEIVSILSAICPSMMS